MSSPVIELPHRAALRQKDAAKYLGIGVTKLWQLTSLGKIRRTSYGTYPIAELDRHLRDELVEVAQ